MKQMAIAVRVGEKANDKGFQKFLKRK